MNYNIGLIDEEITQLRKIRRTIKDNLPDNSTIEFKEYPIIGNRETLSKNVTHEVLNDIVFGRINSLIIDYKIMINTALVEGSDIYKTILDVVPKFPVIILTDLPSSCYEKDFIDADKVYSKNEFFKIQEECSKEKVANIFRNVEHYVKQRAELSIRLNEYFEKLSSDGFSAELYKEIINTEKDLDELFPQGQTEFDKVCKITELREAVELLKSANKLLGDKNETM